MNCWTFKNIETVYVEKQYKYFFIICFGYVYIYCVSPLGKNESIRIFICLLSDGTQLEKVKYLYDCLGLLHVVLGFCYRYRFVFAES